MSDTPNTPDAPRAVSRAERRAQERQTELADCLAKVVAVLDQYDATFDVIEQVVYPNGVARHTFQVRVVPKVAP